MKKLSLIIAIMLIISSCKSKYDHQPIDITVSLIYFIIYFGGVICSYFMLKLSFIHWCSFGDKSEWDWSGRIPCLFLMWGSWVTFIIGFLMAAIAGAFDRKKY